MLRWVGDFSGQRQRVQLHKKHEFPLSFKPDYTDEFCYERGGKVDIPYTTKELPPFPRSQTALASPYEVDPNDPRMTVKKATRLPLIPIKNPQKMVYKNKSCVEMEPGSTFNGKFSMTKVLDQPDPPLSKTAKKQGDAPPTGLLADPCSNANLKANASELANHAKATRDLWRESSTGDAHFKAGSDDVPGISGAMANGAWIDWKNPSVDGLTLIAKACNQNEYELLKYLCSNYSPDLMTVDFSGRNLFHHCSRQNSPQCLTYLLRNMDPKDANALVIAKDVGSGMNTPLHYAAECGSLVIAELLLKLKGKELISIQNKSGLIPFDVAKKNKNYHMCKLLDPLEYLQDNSFLVNRIKALLGNEADDDEDDDDEGGGDDDDDDDEDGGGGGATVKGKFRKLIEMDRKCNQDQAAIVKNKKGKKKGGKKKKK